ncbi:MAG: methyltransferase domain-containing protein [Deltaproteobacteria bacterium]|nr:methyltransferase domain-containing protein [Deltaproteobacteria bacterium]
MAKAEDPEAESIRAPAQAGGGAAQDRPYAGTAARLRRPERLVWLEIDRVVPLCLEGLDVATVLDVGTGGGLFAEAFAARGLTVAGCDVNEELLEAARAAVPQAAFLACTAEELPYDDSSFDLVFLGGVLHEIHDVDRSLVQARRVARARVAVEEWPYREDPHAPPLGHQLPPERVEEAAHRAGFRKVERLELKYMVLYRLDV